MVGQSVEQHAPTLEVFSLPSGTPPTNHGHTTAAWVTVTLVLVGFTVSALAVVLALVPVFWLGMGVVVVGVLAGKVLQVLGHGQGGAATLAKQARPAH